ncbi:DUF6303 family protein [Streptomyces sp. CB00316]|uniref:DUF6303 family protein n=1 Tax=Streptomyces sp. CB00316 TaxID=1703932 RepID=UPI002D2199A4|nr:DUF6303 family protein [Streptomyces sp. CB00316]
MSLLPEARMVLHASGIWKLYVLTGYEPRDWPVHGFGRVTPVPDVPERVAALAALGYTVRDGAEWKWDATTAPRGDCSSRSPSAPSPPRPPFPRRGVRHECQGREDGSSRCRDDGGIHGSHAGRGRDVARHLDAVADRAGGRSRDRRWMARHARL